MKTFVLFLIFGALLWAAIRLENIAEILYYILQELRKHNNRNK
jgi:hypothetical protein